MNRTIQILVDKIHEPLNTRLPNQRLTFDDSPRSPPREFNEDDDHQIFDSNISLNLNSTPLLASALNSNSNPLSTPTPNSNSNSMFATNSWRDSIQTPLSSHETYFQQRCEQLERRNSEILAIAASLIENNGDETNDEVSDDENSDDGGAEGDDIEETDDEGSDDEDSDDEGSDQTNGPVENPINERNNNGEGNENQNRMDVEQEEEEGRGDEVEEEEEVSNAPLFNGASITIKEAAYYLLNWKKDHNCTYSSMDDLLNLLHALILPKDNLLPKNFRALEKVIGLKDPNIYSIHVCVNDCERFPHIPRKQWKDHKDDVCSKCKEKRFFVNEANGSVSPRKKFLPLPIIPQLLSMANNPEYINSYRKMNEEKQNKTCYETFWQGEIVKKLEGIGQPLEKFFESVCFCIGLDGVQYDDSNIPKSVYPVGLKNWCLHINERTKNVYLILYTIIPGKFFQKKNNNNKIKLKLRSQKLGPKAPKNFKIYLEPLFEELSAFFIGIFPSSSSSFSVFFPFLFFLFFKKNTFLK